MVEGEARGVRLDGLIGNHELWGRGGDKVWRVKLNGWWVNHKWLMVKGVLYRKLCGVLFLLSRLFSAGVVLDIFLHIYVN